MPRVFVLVLAAVGALFLLIVLGLRLFSTAAVVPPKTSTGTSTSEAANLDSVRETLHKAVDFDGLRNGIQQLNVYLSAHTDDQPETLSAAERELLKDEYDRGKFGLRDDELAEVARGNFTLLDAHYLDLCFLMRDAARSLRVDKLSRLDQATASFDWTIRQVRQLDHAGELVPPQFAVRRGWGNARERALVFLALLQQFGIDGCILVVPTEGKLDYWIPGALIDKEIYLYDTRMGIPLPGPKGHGVATLTQVRADAALLNNLTVDPKLPYDVKPEQVKAAEIQVAANLSALAPRMRYLQERLASLEKLQLATDPVALLARFQEAGKQPGIGSLSVRVWNHPGDNSSSIRVLRNFVPPDEGGTDKTDRRSRLRRDAVPWNFYPRALAPLQGEPAERLKKLFEIPFLVFDTETRLSKELAGLWLPGLVESQAASDPQGLRKKPRMTLGDRMPRDLVLRGRLEDATHQLVAIRGELNRQRDLVQNQRLDEEAQMWCSRAVPAHAALIQIQQELRNPKTHNPPDAETVKRAQDAVKQIWDHSQAVVTLVQGSAAEPMCGEVTYLLALAKQEQAERAQVGSPSGAKPVTAWSSAESWWDTYLKDYGQSISAPAARAHLARVLQAMGQRERAAGLLEDTSGQMTRLEQTGRLYRARQLRGQP